MSRAVVFSVLSNSTKLQNLGFTSGYILPNYDGYQRPNISINQNNPFFMVLRWGAQRFDPRFYRGPRTLDIWVHMAREISTDYSRIDAVIEIIDPLLTGIIDTPGADGQSVTSIEMMGRSVDLEDPVYQTLCRNASYKIISRNTTTGAE